VLLAALLLAAVNLRPAITSLSPVIERIAEELSLSRGLISLTTALPVLCMGLLAPLAPRLALRFGLVRTVLCCLLLISLALLLRLASHIPLVLIGTALLAGSAIAVAGPLLSGFIKQHFAWQNGGILAAFSLAMAIGGASGAVLGLPVTHLLSNDWTLGLSFWAIPALLAALLWFRLPNTRPETGAQSASLPWHSGRAWLITGFFAVQAGLFYALATWLLARYLEVGFSDLRIHFLFDAFMLVSLPSAWVLPWLAQRLNAHYPLLLVSALCSLLCLVFITFFPLLWPELFALLLGFGLSGSFALSLVLPLHEAHSPLEVSRLSAMMLCAGYSLGSLTPILLGIGRDLFGNYQMPFLLLCLFALLLSALAAALQPRKH